MVSWTRLSSRSSTLAWISARVTLWPEAMLDMPAPPLTVKLTRVLPEASESQTPEKLLTASVRINSVEPEPPAWPCCAPIPPPKPWP